jgi:hypothetical protein
MGICSRENAAAEDPDDVFRGWFLGHRKGVAIVRDLFVQDYRRKEARLWI